MLENQGQWCLLHLAMSQTVKNGSGDGAGGAPKRPAVDADDRGGNKAARASPASGATSAPPKPISMSLGGLKKPPLQPPQKPAKAISIRLGATKPVSVQPVPLKQKSSLAAAAFGESDSDEEEMPPEAKMRMKNIGRETPTSAGPNSFGKTKNGFCNNKKARDKLVEGDNKEDD